MTADPAGGNYPPFPALAPLAFAVIFKGPAPAPQTRNQALTAIVFPAQAPYSASMFLGFLAMPADQDPRYRISVRAQSVYILEQSQPDKDRYAFAYTITLQNTGQTAARLLDRHWVITDANGRVQEVRGDGVVGEQPHLEPGESFRYTSGTLLETPVGSMHGSYGMIADDGTRFDAEIPPFSLAIPKTLH